MVTERIVGQAAGTESASSVRLHGSWLGIARAVWALVAGATIVLTIAGAGPSIQRYLRGEDDASIVPHPVVMAALEANHLSASAFTWFNLGCALIIMLVLMGCGLFIFWRRSDEVLALVTSLAFISFGANVGSFLSGAAPPGSLVGLIASGLAQIGVLLIFPPLVLFPDGRIKPRWATIPLVIWVLTVSAAWVANGGRASNGESALDTVLTLVWVSTTISFVVAAIYRYRRISTPIQRQQTKLVIFSGALLIVIVIVMAAIQGATADVWETQKTSLQPVAVEILITFVLAFALAGFPLAVVFAMQRYRLWDVDFLINRSLVVGGLTVILACVFAGVFFGLNTALQVVLGEGQSVLAAVAATAILAALFNPARRGIARFIDRQLYGIKLDYAEAARKEGPAPTASTGGAATAFGEYTGQSLIGRGGMGEVYRAQHPTLGRLVAMKLMPTWLLPDENARQRFLREAQVIAKLKHPNIVTIYDFGERASVPFMIMEYIDGPDLAMLLKQRGRLPLDEALPLLGDIAAALDFIHENGIIHRDVKPSNVLVEKVTTTGSGKTQRAVLTDFGIARMLDGTTHLTKGGMIGTLDYISPEQIQGASKVDALADVYSFGVLAYHVLTGELPFRHNNPGAMVLAHMMTPPPNPRASNPGLSARAADAVVRAMAKKPGGRFVSAGEFVGALG